MLCSPYMYGNCHHCLVICVITTWNGCVQTSPVCVCLCACARVCDGLKCCVHISCQHIDQHFPYADVLTSNNAIV